MSAPPINVGDCATMRKPHPCGSSEWTVVRVGADIGIKCSKCGRRVLIDRLEFIRRVRSVEPGTGETTPQDNS